MLSLLIWFDLIWLIYNAHYPNKVLMTPLNNVSTVGKMNSRMTFLRNGNHVRIPIQEHWNKTTFWSVETSNRFLHFHGDTMLPFFFLSQHQLTAGWRANWKDKGSTIFAFSIYFCPKFEIPHNQPLTCTDHTLNKNQKLKFLVKFFILDERFNEKDTNESYNKDSIICIS
jgi:hypothetical protein